jgi:hypothetical protein
MNQPSSFEIFLRTGRRASPLSKRLQVKFNPWHDPKDGRFTFVGQGNYFAGGRSEPPSGWTDPFSPKNPLNHSVYIVRKGDTLTRITSLHKGLRVSDLAELNDIRKADTLRVGQRLILPNQAYLEAGREARNNMLNLSHYMATHNGSLPPHPERAPTISEQLDSDWRVVAKNGYEFKLDGIQRTRRAAGEIKLRIEGRSRFAQSQAGKPDRRLTDDGGHFIAARFNGPRDWFNHFAQDASFNRGAYRAIEDSWAKEVRAGRRVFVDIVPQYIGASRRPSAITVIWTVDGELHRREFPNERRGK